MCNIFKGYLSVICKSVTIYGLKVRSFFKCPQMKYNLIFHMEQITGSCLTSTNTVYKVPI